MCEQKYGQLKTVAEGKAAELSQLQMEFDNKRQFDYADEREADRKMAHELKEHPVDCEKEEKYKKLSLELEQLRATYAALKEKKQVI